MDQPPTPVPPRLPPGLTDPWPVVSVGFVLWAVSVATVWLVPAWADARPVCLMGLFVGALGVGIFSLQRRSARRGDKGAQVGL
ncbi:DUF2530 domain-containing protein [Nocardia camponoti]|uniref:DUF2530 domain-containing protein n=1 Tax=Nocardia camponoti TaxID=1616106 RepID=UPI0016659DC6|nr:DUF2530 domain-containing protein [Nocardia camponoti]